MNWEMVQLSGKKAQITVFLVIGIVIIVFFTFLLSRRAETSIVESPADIRPVKLYLDNCLELSSKKAFAEMGVLGGKRTLEEPYFSSAVVETNFLYDEGELRISTKEEFKKNLEDEIGLNLQECFSGFSEPGTSLEKGDANVTVDLFDSFTEVSAKWPIDITINGKTTNINSPEPVKLDVRLNAIYEVASNITQKISENPSKLDFVPLLEPGMNITIDATPQFQVFLIIDPESTIEQKPYGFIFASRT